jgi:hypothetical protein
MPDGLLGRGGLKELGRLLILGRHAERLLQEFAGVEAVVADVASRLHGGLALG